MNSNKVRIRIGAFLMFFLLMFTSLFGYLSISAAGGNPLSSLRTTVGGGSYMYVVGNKNYDFTANRYKVSGGGYLLYNEVINMENLSECSADFFLEEKFETLTSGAKQDILKDVFTLANAVADDTAKGKSTSTGSDAPTEETVADFMEQISQQSGMGSSMLAMIMQNTKPDYVTANRIYAPFSGTVGTILGIVSILIMALLGVTMALDLAYITIPAFQMAMSGGEDSSGNGTKSKGIGGIISQEAKKAVQAADGGSGGQGGSGEYKAAVGIYFKYRWKGLVVLGVCLLYLVQGQIYSFVAWFIDLFSGFLGF